MSSRELVVEPGEQVEITIESVNHDGDGVGRFKGMAVFVPRTVPGEQVLTRISLLKKNYAIGEAIRITSTDKGRTEPRCPAFESCGGSKLQHINYSSQLDIKRKLVEDSLKRVGRITGVDVKPVIGMSQPWEYRNKAQFHVSVIDGKIKLGFYEEGSYTLVPSTECLLLDRQIREIAAMVEGYLNKFRVPLYDWDTGKGFLRHIVVRKSWHLSRLMVIFVTSAEKFPEILTLARELKAKAPQLVSIVRNINRSSTRQVFGNESQLLAGHSTITDCIGDLEFKISPASFFQVNPLQTEVLYQKALEYAGLTGSETVLDVYCGIGTISLLLARHAARVIGFEISTEAVNDAAVNARHNKINNVEFVSGKAENRLPALAAQGTHPDVIVVDPPRQGIEKKALQAIADMSPKRIIYISCDPATMARDLQFLSYRGYRTVEVQPVDMFAQTSHVESVALQIRN